MDNKQVLERFLAQHELPIGFLHLAREWYLPLAKKLARQHTRAGKPLLVGIAGSQGSGKSTLASLLALLLENRYHLAVTNLSIDDFYLTHAARQSLAIRVHPLLATRGVPGTHDLPLIRDTLTRLFNHHGPVATPVFNKATDDRVAVSEWQQVTTPVDMVLVEGWCFGTPAQPESALFHPVNQLEAEEDPEGIWRRYVNQQISVGYQPVYDQVDAWIMLQAPSFDCVYRWRLEQEHKLANRLAPTDASEGVMSEEQIHRFIQHYQRLTEHALQQLPTRVNFLFRLGKEREIIEYREPQPLLCR